MPTAFSGLRHSVDARRSVGKMFSHEPLLGITKEEKDLLKTIARSKIGMHLNGQSKKRLVGAGAERQRAMIRENEKGIQGSRDASAAYGKEIFRKIDGLIGKFGKINCLDVGAGQGHTLQEIKKRYGNKVETHSVSYEDEPTHADLQHVFDAAFFPKEFRGKFHLALSHIAIRYMPAPNYVIENVFRSLVPGGKAKLHLQPFGEADRYLQPGNVAYFARQKLQKKYPVLAMLRFYSKEKSMYGFDLSLFPFAISRETREILRRGIIKKVFPDRLPEAVKKHFSGLSDFARGVETMEEIERLKFLQKSGSCLLKTTRHNALDPIPVSLEITKIREPTAKEEYYWKRKTAREPKMTIGEFAEYIRAETGKRAGKPKE